MYDNGDNEEGMQMEINQYDVDSERDQTQVWGRWMEFAWIISSPLTTILPIFIDVYYTINGNGSSLDQYEFSIVMHCSLN